MFIRSNKKVKMGGVVAIEMDSATGVDGDVRVDYREVHHSSTRRKILFKDVVLENVHDDPETSIDHVDNLGDVFMMNWGMEMMRVNFPTIPIFVLDKRVSSGVVGLNLSL